MGKKQQETTRMKFITMKTILTLLSPKPTTTQGGKEQELAQKFH